MCLFTDALTKGWGDGVEQKEKSPLLLVNAGLCYGFTPWCTGDQALRVQGRELPSPPHPAFSPKASGKDEK